MEPIGSGNQRAQYRRLLVIGAVLIVAWIVWSVRGALLPFAIGLLIAYLLAPLVRWIERPIPNRGIYARIRRPFSIIAVYLLAALVLALAAVSIIPGLIDQTVELIDNMPSYWEDIREESDYWSRRYEEEIPQEVRDQIEANVDEIVAAVRSFVQSAATTTIGTVGRFISLFIGLVLVPLWVYYVLRDERNATAFFYGLWPEELREDVYQIVKIVDRVLAAYIRGQLFLGVVVGVVTGIGLWLLDVQQPLALGVVSGILELVPILGPWLSFIVAAIVVLATDPSKIFWVALLFLGIQQLENTFLVPRIQGNAVDMSPALIMVLIVVGAALWGFIGIVVIVPLAAVARDVFKYVYGRLSDPEDVQAGPLSDEPG